VDPPGPVPRPRLAALTPFVGIAVVGVVGGAPEVLELLEELDPDGGEGFRRVEVLHRLLPEVELVVRVVVLVVVVEGDLVAYVFGVPVQQGRRLVRPAPGDVPDCTRLRLKDERRHVELGVSYASGLEYSLLHR